MFIFSKKYQIIVRIVELFGAFVSKNDFFSVKNS